MKPSPTVALAPLLAGCLIVGLALSSCSAAGPQGRERLQPYRQALAATSPPGTGLSLAQARERFASFYADFTPEAVRGRGPEVFAPDAYLNDQIHELHGVAAITDYLARQAEAFKEASFVVEDAAESRGEFYFRWQMTFRLAGSEDKPEVAAIGVSHVRFDEQGRIAFQVDYWDTASSVYERLPVVGGMLRWVKKQF